MDFPSIFRQSTPQQTPPPRLWDGMPSMSGQPLSRTHIEGADSGLGSQMTFVFFYCPEPSFLNSIILVVKKMRLPDRKRRLHFCPADRYAPPWFCRNRSRGTFNFPRTDCAFFSWAGVHLLLAASSSHDLAGGIPSDTVSAATVSLKKRANSSKPASFAEADDSVLAVPVAVLDLKVLRTANC